MHSNDIENPISLPDNINITTMAGAIDIYENIFDADTSNKIIKILENANDNINCPIEYSNAKIGLGEDGGLIRSNLLMSIFEHNNKDNDLCDCETLSVLEFLKEKLSLFVRYYCFKYGLDIGFDEGLQLLKYNPGKQYKPHIDYGFGADHRILSGLIYLNPGNYLGGGTYFNNFNEMVQPQSPALALFPSNYAYKHAAQPIFEGQKYVIVTWFGPPWRMHQQ